MRLGPWELAREIGRGAYGTVFEARGPSGERAAVKVLRGQGPQAGERFDRERRLLASLGEAEGFVPLLDSGVSPQGAWIAMPFVGGGTLRDRLAAGPLALDVALSVVRNLAAAAGRAHALGIVHRDLKPENVLFTEKGRPLIADLGLAKHFLRDSAHTVSLTRDGVYKGTLGYMPPEQMSDARSVGPPADVFALAAILYECVTGQAAFVAETPFELVEKAERGEFEPLPGPDWLSAVVERALDPRPAERFPDGAALAAALEARAAPPRAVSTRRRFLLVTGGLLGAACAGGALLALAGRTRGTGGPRGGGPEPSPPPPPNPITPPPTRPSGFESSRFTKLRETIGSTAWKMPEGISSVALLPGDRALASSHDGTVLMIDLGTGREVQALRGHSGAALAVAARADGSLLASAGRDKVVRLWRPGEAAPVATLEGHTESVNVLAFSRDGTRVVSGGHDRTVRVFDVASRKTLRVFKGHTGPVHGVAIHGDRVASASDDRTVRIADSLEGESRVLHEHEDVARAVAFSPDGERVASCGHDNSVRVTTAGKTIVLAAHRNWIYQVAFLDRDRVLTSSRDRCLALWDVAEQREVWRKEAHKGGVTALALDPARKRALSGGTDHLLVAWDVAAGEPLASAVEGHRGGVLGLADAGKSGVLSVGHDHVLRRGAAAAATTTDGWLLDLALSADGSRLATASEGGVVTLWSTRDATRLGSVAHASGVTGVAFIEKSRFVTASRDGELELWDAKTLKELRAASTTKGYSGVAVSLDGRRLATAGTDHKVRLWDPETLAQRAVLEGHGRPVAAVAFLPDGERLLSGSDDGELRSWDVTRAALVDRFAGHGARITALAVAPDGSFAASAALDGKIRLWRPGEVRPADELDIATSADVPSALAWSSDSRSLLAGTGRGAVLRFDVTR